MASPKQTRSKPPALQTVGFLLVQAVHDNDRMRTSISMDFHPRTLRSASNSPTLTPTPRRRSDTTRPWGSHEQLECTKTDANRKTLPSKLQARKFDCVLTTEGHLVAVTKKEQRKLSRKTKDIAHPLHYPKSTEALVELLKEGYDPNTTHHEGFYPIHTYISKQRKKKYVDLLYILLSQSTVNVDSTTLTGTPALHLAICEANLHIVKLLLVFGANVNFLDSKLRTALDVAVECNNEQAITLLQALGALQGEVAKKSCFDAKIPRLKSFYDTAKIKSKLMARRQAALIARSRHRQVNENDAQSNGYHHGAEERGASNGVALSAVANGHGSHLNPPAMVNGAIAKDVGKGGVSEEDIMRERLFSNQSLERMTLKDMEDGNTLSTLYERLQQCINITLDISGSFSANTDEAIAITMQQKELLKYKKTEVERKPFSFNVQEGSRILFLDGGGIRGLVQIEVLEQLEKKTGRKIVELFDWIVGTSTGGIVALGLVYAKKSLAELRQLYFRMKEKVFGSDRFGFAYNTENLEELLKDVFGTTMTMADEELPKVIITAVNKRTTMPELHFFNNCFHDDFSTQLVWKVARYTSAAPMFFTEYEDYVDGGVLANNPCSYGLSAIQNFYRQLGQKLDIALVVSVGSGIFPVEDLGKTDAQEFLFFGKHWLKAGHAIKARAKSLITLLTTALVESESVARSFSSRMQEQGVPFYRFNPHLDEVIASGEIDLVKLVGMQLKTKIYVMNPQEQGKLMLDELVRLFHLVAEMNRKKLELLTNK